MKAFTWPCLATLAASLAAWVSPAEQRAMDEQRRAGFGPGPDAMANCLMGTAQQREAAQQREDARGRALSEQRDRDRAATERAGDDAAAQQRRDDVMRDSNKPATTGFGRPAMGGTDRNLAYGANAGSLVCH